MDGARGHRFHVYREAVSRAMNLGVQERELVTVPSWTGWRERVQVRLGISVSIYLSLYKYTHTHIYIYKDRKCVHVL